MKNFSVRSLIWLTLLVAIGLAYFLERRARLRLESDYSELLTPVVRIVQPLHDDRWAEFSSQSVMARLYLPLQSKSLQEPKAVVRFLSGDLTELASSEVTQFLPLSPHVYSFYVNDNRRSWSGFAEGIQHIRVDVFEQGELIASDVKPIKVVRLDTGGN